MSEIKNRAVKAETKVRTAIDEIVKLLMDEGFSYETAVMITPTVIRLMMEDIEKEMRGEK